MPYIPPEQVARAREIDLLTYLQTCEPEELVRFSGNTYCTRSHDSLKISNGKWFWHAQGFGGRSALDYLIKVRQMPFTEAVETLLRQSPAPPQSAKPPPPKRLELPRASPSPERVVRYLTGRGLDREVIRFCLDTGRLYESLPYHNAVFLGRDRFGQPRYAQLRSTTGSFKGEAPGSDKRFSFSIPAGESDTLHVFESSIDLLSYVTLENMDGRDGWREHLLSLGGIACPPKGKGLRRTPPALEQFQREHPGLRYIILRLDNDPPGRSAASALMAHLSDKHDVLELLPPTGKDYNEWLCHRRGIPVRQARAERGR